MTAPLVCAQAIDAPGPATARDGRVFQIYQFTPETMPHIDGKNSDWDRVPAAYRCGTAELNDTEDGHGTDIDTNDIDVQVTLGWVKGLNRLYVLYEAYDDFWDFERFNPEGYLNDIFELVVDGDLSGGPFIYNPLVPEARKWGASAAHVRNHLAFSGYHAQNYHIFTPPVRGSWTLIWGSQPWIATFPYAHRAYSFDGRQGEAGKLTLEFWVTPYDYAPVDGPELAKESRLVENKLIGLSWSVLDFDGGKRDGHYNLSHDTRMVANASYLCAFRLMPLERDQVPDFRADWSFSLIENREQTVAFRDESVGDIESWYWDFGNGDFSTEQHPLYQYPESGVHYNVTLEITGAGKSDKKTRFWEVMIP
ncbi:PKD domain-containing protein [Cyclobacterium xiamenense]|uniref:PKD domain-containing protein n=1 Tax=Cyclobacterium xiamenense TaxID=1297121 RepID=UPI0035CF59AD